MEHKVKKTKKVEGTLDGFSFVSPPPYLWKSRRRPASRRNVDTVTAPTAETTEATPKKQDETTSDVKMQDAVTQAPELSERRKALFEPLEPINNSNGKRSSAEQLLPPPDFDSTIYPKGWLVGKKRKLVNVDVVESMRRIAVQEMNRKDREIDGLNEQLDEDARCLEHLQLQLLQEKSKRSEMERENAMLQEQITMLMNMLEETEAAGNEENINEPSE